jgi:hypothetical protein
VAVCEAGFSSVATVKPLGRIVLRNVGSKLVAVAKPRRYYNCKKNIELILFKQGVFHIYNYQQVIGVIA